MAPQLNAALWAKMIAAGAVLSIGGPALIYWVSPTPEELFKKYNPDLQRRSLENRDQKQQDFDDFVNRMKIDAKSSKPIWVAAAEREAEEKIAKLAGQEQQKAQVQQQQKEMLRMSQEPGKSKSGWLGLW